MKYGYYIALEIGDSNMRNITVLSQTSFGQAFLPLGAEQAICYTSIEAAKQELKNHEFNEGLFILIV